jgi:hypothetical protein
LLAALLRRIEVKQSQLVLFVTGLAFGGNQRVDPFTRAATPPTTTTNSTLAA